MKWEDIKIKNNAELEELLSEQRAELQTLTFQASSSQLKQVHKIKVARKAIAKLKILLAQRAKEDKASK
jgi:ribosomal protein L29